ncbi:acylneuraminate cytidylyltransferase family protein [Pseudodesulfovibrio sp.]|nr:acylneuraminate cytidylyltransferase family protein [Pseudodesulfovibrio sp.]
MDSIPMSLYCDEVVAIIPARGGSKGLPGKNIRELCGKPLIAYSIEAALMADTIDRVIVSTDDESIAEIARDSGAEVPFLRPAELAGDKSHIGGTLLHAKDTLYGDRGEFVIWATMFPTSPFRTPGLIDYFVNIAKSGFSNVFTARRITPPNVGYYSIEEGSLKSLGQGLDWTVFVRPYGNLAVSWPVYPPREYVHVLEDEFSCIDIDTLEDFYLAEEVINASLFDFQCTKSPASVLGYRDQRGVQ